jgi:hypothetical protein
MKIYTLICTAAVAIAMAACSSSDIETSATEQGTAIKLTSRSTIDSDNPSSRVGLTDDNNSKIKVSWNSLADGETYSMVKLSDETPVTFTMTEINNDGSANFTGTVSNPTNDLQLYAFYPALSTSSTCSATDLPIDLSTQDGTLNQNKLYMYGKTTYSSSSPNVTVNFKHLVSILKLTLTFPSGIVGHVDKITIKANGSVPLPNKATANLQSGSLISGENGLTVTCANNMYIVNNSVTAYIYMPSTPTLSGGITIRANVGEYSYKGVVTTNKAISAGKVYTLTKELTQEALIIPSNGGAYTKAGTYIMEGNYTGNVSFAKQDVTLILNNVTNSTESPIKITNGTATINVEGTNHLTSTSKNTPPICLSGTDANVKIVGQDETDRSKNKLTVDFRDTDTGSITGDNPGIVGIGNSPSVPYCGNIDIENTTLIAKSLNQPDEGSVGSPAIGGGSTGTGGTNPISCGNITIKNSDVTAIGGFNSAAIGLGVTRYGTLGNITITNKSIIKPEVKANNGGYFSHTYGTCIGVSNTYIEGSKLTVGTISISTTGTADDFFQEYFPSNGDDVVLVGVPNGIEKTMTVKWNNRDVGNITRKNLSDLW